jgi:hypothetical protein
VGQRENNGPSEIDQAREAGKSIFSWSRRTLVRGSVSCWRTASSDGEDEEEE